MLGHIPYSNSNRKDVFDIDGEKLKILFNILCSSPSQNTTGQLSQGRQSPYQNNDIPVTGGVRSLLGLGIVTDLYN